jgi:hypothetical protein
MAKGRGRERKAKRKVRQKAEAELVQTGNGHWVPSGVQDERSNNKLVREALRWETNSDDQSFRELANIEQLRESPESDPSELRRREFALVKRLRAKQIAVLVTQRNMISPNQQVSNAAVQNLLRMEAQNQSDEHHSEDLEKPEAAPLQVNILQLRQELLNDPDFISNAHRSITEGNGHSGPVRPVHE